MSLSETIKDLVVNDYFTPNIKAEVILDTLLAPYIPQILKKQCGVDAKLLTKEMSLEEIPKDGQQPNDDRGSKIDYLLEGKCVYLVELKTTDGSIEAKQAERYLNNCCDLAGNPKTFGNVFGNKLLRIVHKRYKGIPCDPQGLEEAFQTLVDCTSEYAEHTKQFLKAKDLAATHKYLYTLGQILDKCPDLDALWKKELQLVYITPKGKTPHSKLLSATRFYLHPENADSISLRDAVTSLDRVDDDSDGALAKLLQSIITEIYPAKEVSSCQS